ncbi:CRISPR-associated endoribonuclease Cas6 [Streptosporangium sp. NPDC006930]|uniref:CRISPR-associated endoribonuclease Cas6 n=1 Tax=unclassified Streptosporangium TaxID=2632669 RepID=UPI003417888A
MRVQLDVHTEARELAWSSVVRPGRALAYSLLDREAPELGTELHAQGMKPYGMVPFGYSAPVFPLAERRRGVYSLGGPGTWELGSPVPRVVHSFGSALAGMPVIAWGATAFFVDAVRVVEAPTFSSGGAVFRTSTPVVVKGTGIGSSGVRETRQDWLLPGEPGWDLAFERNLRRKAETLSLNPDVTLERVTWVGPKRSFTVAGSTGKGGSKPGACVEVTVSADPEVLQALWSWGLGQANSAGFGWVIA